MVPEIAPEPNGDPLGGVWTAARPAAGGCRESARTGNRATARTLTAAVPTEPLRYGLRRYLAAFNIPGADGRQCRRRGGYCQRRYRVSVNRADGNLRGAYGGGGYGNRADGALFHAKDLRLRECVAAVGDCASALTSRRSAVAD